LQQDASEPIVIEWPIGPARARHPD